MAGTIRETQVYFNDRGRYFNRKYLFGERKSHEIRHDATLR